MNSYVIAMLIGYIGFYLRSLHPYFNDRYCFKDEAEKKERPFSCFYYDYCIPKDVWCSRKAFRFLRRHKSNIKYPDVISSGKDTGAEFFNYREFQFVGLEHYTIIVFVVIDSALYLMSKLVPIHILPVPFGLLVMAFLEGVVRYVMSYPLMKQDIMKIRGFTYPVCKEGAIVSAASENLPDLWKLSTLLDVYYRLGEAKMRCCEAGNYSIYALKDGMAAIILFDKRFEILPKCDSKAVYFRYNDALGVRVKKIIVADKDNYPDILCEAMQFVIPEDIEEIKTLFVRGYV